MSSIRLLFSIALAACIFVLPQPSNAEITREITQNRQSTKPVDDALTCLADSQFDEVLEIHQYDSLPLFLLNLARFSPQDTLCNGFNNFTFYNYVTLLHSVFRTTSDVGLTVCSSEATRPCIAG
ncbi:hypothetical protein EBR25_07315 [bacterium]|nr:hypothetical protein [bacterium]